MNRIGRRTAYAMLMILVMAIVCQVLGGSQRAADARRYFELAEN
jgi:hypothetical protein